MQQQRAYDALYDATYTVAGLKDHYREQAQAGGITVDKVPLFGNLFSELPHHPSQTCRLKAADRLPTHVPRDFRPRIMTLADLAARSSADQVSGARRPLFTRRPLLMPRGPQDMATTSQHVIVDDSAFTSPRSPASPQPLRGDSYAPGANAAAPASSAYAYAADSYPSGKRDAETQSDYRESEAQTVPWDPDDVLPEGPPNAKQLALSEKHSSTGPELLALQDLKFGAGLPAGLTEVEIVEARRAKRAFNAALPSIDDAAQLPLRQALMEEWETREWEQREGELKSVQDERLALLERALHVREQEIENFSANRIAALMATRTRELSAKFAGIHKQRISTIRQLAEKHRKADLLRPPPKSVVDTYADYGSGVYAPLQREGKFPDSKPPGLEIDTTPFQPRGLQDLLSLEASIPARRLESRIARPQPPAKPDSKQRRQMLVSRHLEYMHQLIQSEKSAASSGDKLPRHPSLSFGSGEESLPASLVRRMSLAPFERPETPRVSDDVAAERRYAAAVLLQRLIRGRAVQVAWTAGMHASMDLIMELRQPVGTGPRPEDVSEDVRYADELLGRAITELYPVLLETDKAKRQQMWAELVQSREAQPAQQTDPQQVQDQAAARIQAAQRGRQARREVAEMRRSAALLAKYDEVDSVVKLQALARGRAARQKALQQQAAAVKIQSMQRGRAARRQLAQDRISEAMEEKYGTFDDYERIAKVQSVVRGRQARRRVARMRAEAGEVEETEYYDEGEGQEEWKEQADEEA